MGVDIDWRAIRGPIYEIPSREDTHPLSNLMNLSILFNNSLKLKDPLGDTTAAKAKADEI